MVLVMKESKGIRVTAPNITWGPFVKMVRCRMSRIQTSSNKNCILTVLIYLNIRSINIFPEKNYCEYDAPCQNGATCIPEFGGYNCTCDPRYNSDNCENCEYTNHNVMFRYYFLQSCFTQMLFLSI